VECATSRCYTNAYRSLDISELKELSRVKNIYSKLALTIGSYKAKRSKLFVINSDGYPWAVVLSDNSVVVTKGAIRLMYAEGDKELGDARVAFVLGHELSHLTTEDLFHHRAFLVNEVGRASVGSWTHSNPSEELRADLRGYTFATIAGFRTDRLLNEDDDFFRDWLL